MIYREPPSLCARHPLSPAAAVCAKCRARICEGCAVWAGLVARCPSCASRRRRMKDVARAAGWLGYVGFIVLVGVVVGALVWVWPARPRCDDWACWVREARTPHACPLLPPEKVTPICRGWETEVVAWGSTWRLMRTAGGTTCWAQAWEEPRPPIRSRFRRPCSGCDAENVLGGLVGMQR